MDNIENESSYSEEQINHLVVIHLLEVKQLDQVACAALKKEAPAFLLGYKFDEVNKTLTFVKDEQEVLFSSLVKPFTLNEILEFYKQIYSVFEACEEWYLRKDALALNLEQIVYAPVSNQLKFIYIPDLDTKQNLKQYKNLFLELLLRCKSEDESYWQVELYKYLNQSEFQLNDFKEMIEYILSHICKQVVEEKLIEETIDETIEEIKSESMESAVESSKIILQPKQVEPLEPIELTKQQEVFEAHKEETCISEDKQEEAVDEAEVESSELDVEGNALETSEKECEIELPPISEGEKEANSVLTKERLTISDEEMDPYLEAADLGADMEKVPNAIEKVMQSFGGHKAMDKVSEFFGRVQKKRPCLKLTFVPEAYNLPKTIALEFEADIFSIGRSSGEERSGKSSFEFSKAVSPVSRVHAEFGIEQSSYYIRDLGSSNGTYLNGIKLIPRQNYRLEEGDLIAFAIATLENRIEYRWIE